MYKTIEFLLIDDNPGDIRLVEECFKELKIANRLTVVQDCVEAMRFVQRQGEYASTAFPDIVLVSIALLWNNVENLVHSMRSDATLQHVPIVVLTSFEGEEESLSTGSPVNLSIPKPLNLDSIQSIVKQLDDFAFVITRDEG